jgi:hypothetical protein
MRRPAAALAVSSSAFVLALASSLTGYALASASASPAQAAANGGAGKEAARAPGRAPAKSLLRDAAASKPSAPPATLPPPPAPSTTAAPPPPPAPPTTSPPPPPATDPPAPAEPSGYGCAAAVAYLDAHAAPGFQIECPGDAEGHEAMTCVNVAGVCPGEQVIAISDPCPAAYMNEASNSWVLLGESSASIDPYGSC